MYIYIIVAFIIFIYGAFSTIFHSTDMVGNIGRSYGEANLNLFGYLAYIDLLILLYPLYRLYRNRDLLKQIDFYVGWIIFFISLILLQSLTLEFNAVGSVGTTLKLFLLPFIGKAGLWLLWILTFSISLVLIVEDIPDLSFAKEQINLFKNHIVGHTKNLIDRFENPFFDKRSTEVMTTIVSSIDEASKSNSHIIAHQRLKRITHKKPKNMSKLPFDTLYLRDILESPNYNNAKSPLTIILGKDIKGNPFLIDLKKLPHLLIAGAKDSGKSMGIDAMILSLLYRNYPNGLKLLLIDPKMLKFSIYNEIPHLLTPVITDSSKAIEALSNMVGEMERRYKLMAKNKTKNIEIYNEKVQRKDGRRLPYIVVIINELADLIMDGGRDVEYSIVRLAQMARVTGIYLVVATQRPSVDVITGLIKANFPSRLSYKVEHKIDSKVILDSLGADALLGQGDALFTLPATDEPVRLYAPWSSKDEIEKIVEFLKAQGRAIKKNKQLEQ